MAINYRNGQNQQANLILANMILKFMLSDPKITKLSTIFQRICELYIVKIVKNVSKHTKNDKKWLKWLNMGNILEFFSFDINIHFH